MILSQVVPVGFKFQNASSPGRYDEVTRTVTWVLNDVLPGQNRELTLELVPTQSGDHKLVAQVNSARGLKSEAEIRTHVEGLSSVEVEITNLDNAVEVGTESAFEIKVTNTGTKMETNLQLVCELADQLEFRAPPTEPRCSIALRAGPSSLMGWPSWRLAIPSCIGCSTRECNQATSASVPWFAAKV